jgi:hypothetical protein
MRRFLICCVLWGTGCFAQSALQTDPTGWTDIMPGANLGGWTRLPFMTTTPMDPVSQWTVDQNAGVLLCEGNRGHEWLRFDKELADIMLHVEFRFTAIEGGKGYNSGIMIRNSADGVVWHQAQIGGEGTGYLFGGSPVEGKIQRFNLRSQMKENRIRPPGEWNTVELRTAGPKITLWVNGDVTTELANTEVLKGYLGLEAEGYRIEFRNIKLKRLN